MVNRKKKIGLLTFHCAHNYGAVLQAYALQEYIKSLGCDVEILDYRPNEITQSYRIIPKLLIKSNSISSKLKTIIKYFILFIFQICIRIWRRRLFLRFMHNKYHLSSSMYNYEFNKNYDYDLYIIGSDQVWNPTLTKGLNPIYFGDFDVSKFAKKVTYAASSSYYDFTEIQKKEIRKYLDNFYKLSVRENELSEYIESEFNKKAQVVLDPTLLVDIDVWNNIAIKPSRERYLLTYIIGSEVSDIAKQIAKERNLKIINISPIYKDVIRNKKVFGPAEFVGLFKYAEYIVCSSFHGTVFSILYNKEFCSVGSGNHLDSRVKSLLHDLNLENRLIFNIKDKEKLQEPIDYRYVNTKLIELKKGSADFLNRVIYD